MSYLIEIRLSTMWYNVGGMVSKPISIRLPEETIVTLNEIASKKHLPMRTMLRAWVMDRVVRETMNLPPPFIWTAPEGHPPEIMKLPRLDVGGDRYVCPNCGESVAEIMWTTLPRTSSVQSGDIRYTQIVCPLCKHPTIREAWRVISNSRQLDWKETEEEATK